nr:anosmin-1 [Onthophagus taurus]
MTRKKCSSSSPLPILFAVVVFILIKLSSAKCRFKEGQPDSILLATCEARCLHQDDKDMCQKLCVRRGLTKPGSCPRDIQYNSNLTLSPFSAVCVDTCSKDSQCPGILKCCRHDCGVSCQHPLNLHNATGLPPIPTEIRVREKRRRKAAIIEWSKPHFNDFNVIYILQERHYTGKHLQADHMTEWSACMKARRARIRFSVKPGTWYNFRIAAVNENGTRGFSHMSLNFIYSADPKPPKEPTDVQVGPLWLQNGSLNTELIWSPPHSDLPIQRYSVFWSRRLMGVTDSVLVRQQYVPKDQTRFLLQGLQPNSSYFLQIQAIAYYGKQKLRGRKSGLVLNTTILANVTEDDYYKYQQNNFGLNVKKPYWKDGDLRTRIVWKKNSSKYNITWSNVSCNDRDVEVMKLNDITTESKYEVHSLKFGCRYKVTLREFSRTKTSHDTTVTFATPLCLELRKNNKHVRCHNL